jgi:hypothetical protein
MVRTARIGCSAAGLLLLLGVTSQARAVNLTGTWDGRLTCERSQDDTRQTTSGVRVTVLISQVGENVIHLFAETPPGGLHMQGVVVDNGANQDDGGLSALLCESDVGAGAFTINGRANNTDAERGTLRAIVSGSSTASSRSCSCARSRRRGSASRIPGSPRAVPEP